MDVSLYELAWAAGFFDGEGCTTLRRRGNWRELSLSVSQSERTTLERFQQAVGGLGKVAGPWPTSNGGPHFRFDARGYVEAQAVLAMLWRFLSQPKRDQAWQAMINCRDYFQARALHGKGRSKFTLAEVKQLRSEFADLQIGRQRIPHGWIDQRAAEVGVSRHTLAHILHGHGYA